MDDSAFKPVWDVIKALRAHDEELGEQLDELRRAMGSERAADPGCPDKIHVDLPRAGGRAFARAFDVRLVETDDRVHGSSGSGCWSSSSQDGHAHVLQSYEVNEYPLGKWVNKQRAIRAKGSLDTDREHRLEKLPGWAWEPKADRWEQAFSRLLDHVQVHGHACVPLAYIVDDFALGRWVIKQRARYAEGALDRDRQSRLQRLPGWTWDTVADKWEEGFRRLVGYVELNGHARVPPDFIADGYKLGPWVANQRTKQNHGTLDADCQSRLQHLPGWTWTPSPINGRKVFGGCWNISGPPGTPTSPQRRPSAVTAWASGSRFNGRAIAVASSTKGVSSVCRRFPSGRGHPHSVSGRTGFSI